MSLLTGSASCARFNVTALPEEINFDLIGFRPIQPGSQLREADGFLPFEPEEPYEIGARRWAFRVRIDKVKPNPGLLREMVKRMVKEEAENIGPPSPKRKKQIRQDAEDTLLQTAQPSVTFIECVLEETVLYVGSTSKTHLGTVLDLLKRVGVEVEFKTPWLDAGQEEEFSEVVDLKEPGQSVHGCRFLHKLLSDPDVLVEPEKGSVKLVNKEGTRLSLAGPVLNELDRCLEQEALPLSARLLMNEFNFTFDGLSYRINGLKLDTFKNKHWTEALDERLDKIKELYAWLDEKYEALVLGKGQKPKGKPVDPEVESAIEASSLPWTDVWTPAPYPHWQYELRLNEMVLSLTRVEDGLWTVEIELPDKESSRDVETIAEAVALAEVWATNEGENRS